MPKKIKVAELTKYRVCYRIGHYMAQDYIRTNTLILTEKELITLILSTTDSSEYVLEIIYCHRLSAKMLQQIEEDKYKEGTWE